MHVQSIQIDGFRESDRACQGNVAFLCSDRTVHVSLSAQGSMSRPALIRLAIEKLQRMPEYRRGANTISFAPGLVA